METVSQKQKKVKIKYFGMKVTSEERDSIHILANAKGKSAKEVIMSLIYDALTDVKIEAPKRITAKELRALPIREQEKILEEQAKKAAKHYEVINDAFDIVED